MRRGPEAQHHLGWVGPSALVICVPPQSFHSFPAKARGHKGVRASNALPRGKGIDHFYVTEFLYILSSQEK